MRQTLLAGLPAYSVTLSDGQIDTLCRFGEALIEKNAVMNLTAITEPSAVAQLHFLDCIALLNAADFREKRVIDVGCGAGFPGVPLKIAEPSIRLTLLDSLAKRMNWLSETLPALGVDAEIITARAEEFAAQRREQYDLATSRAVARLNVLAELCLPYVRVGGKFLAMKGALAQEEVEEARRGIERLGGHVLRIFEYPVADAVHKAVVIEKLRPTPPQYPRAFAKIKKSPL
ncbi:MAG: 16S rRNA (guanine(527)-N(7))-methyltransferase RsmG [Firmicutes bacterium]|nr:16S rRNA (guanine(527)-N(7))-methyltransferase RsmG [Bacillota bacterium]